MAPRHTANRDRGWEMTRRGTLIFSLSLLALAACAPVTVTTPAWQNPDRPSEAWSTDLQEGRALADREAERSAGQGSLGRIDSEMGPARSLESRMDVYAMKRERNDLLGECLRQRGYRPAEKK